MNYLILEALSNIIHSKLRSLLTLLGVLIGTASVVALVSSGELATQHALAQFKNLGTDLFAISITPSQSSDSGNASGSAQSGSLTLADAIQLGHAAAGIQQLAPYTNYFSSVSYRGTEIDANVIGSTQSLQNIAKIDMAKGRFVSDLDNSEFYCVIGDGVSQKIQQIGVLDPIGTQIRVGDYIYTIIGVAKPWQQNMFMFADINNAIVIPIQNSFLLSKYVQIQNIIFRLSPNADVDFVQQQVTHKINSILPNQQVFSRSAKQLILSMEKQRQTLTILLSLIGGVSLVVGGIGVMNIMLVSVTERRREIGIRMAVGATAKDIGFMFIAESIVLTLFGGIIGIIIGVIISYVAAKFSGWEFQLFLFPPLIGFLVSVFVGVFFGYYPAYKASRLDPIQTLRSD